MVFGSDGYSSENADFIEEDMERNTGVYITEVSKVNPNIRIEVPYYQLGILWGSHYQNKSDRGNVSMWKSFDDLPDDYSRPQEERCEDILLGLVGNKPTEIFTIEHDVITGQSRTGGYIYSDKGPYFDFVPQWNNISEVNVTYYRVNSYNFKKAEYTVSNRDYLNMGPCNAEVNCTIEEPAGLILVKKNVNDAVFNKK